MRKLLLLGLLAGLLFSHIALADDISNGSWNTVDGSNSAAPPNGWPAGMFPNQVEPTARSNMGGVKRWWERANPTLNTTGSGGAYVLTPSNTSYPTAYTQGEVTCAKANFTSVGNDTLNVNGLGAKALYVRGTSGMVRIGANAIVNGQQFCGAYDSALNSGAGGFQVLSSLSVGSQNTSTSGWMISPGGVITLWVPYSITATQTTNTPPGTSWGQGVVNFPISCPTGVLSWSFGANTTANGQFASASGNIGLVGGTIFITSGSSATQPMTGVITVICY
jgi:hypothetical protein